MGLTPAQEAVLDWMGGTTDPRSLRYVILGAQGNVPAHFSRYVCLYPDRPRVRKFTVELPEGYPDSLMPRPRELDVMIRKLTLPNTIVERYRKGMHTMFPTLTEQEACRLGAKRMRDAGLPIGVFALGTTAVRRVTRAILVVNALVSPTWFMEELRRAL